MSAPPRDTQANPPDWYMDLKPSRQHWTIPKQHQTLDRKIHARPYRDAQSRSTMTLPITLMGPTDPPPYTIHNESGKAPLLLVADHASPVIPSALHQLGLDAESLNRHITWDIGSANLARGLADLLDAPLILAGYSRLVIDLNRQVDDSTAIPAISDGTVIPGNEIVDEQQRSSRIAAFFQPYHAAISARLDHFHSNGIAPAFLSVHTCTPLLNQLQRPWHIGVMWDKDPRIAVPLLQQLNRMKGLCIGDNQPYSGRHPHDFTIDFHAERRGIAHVGIEVRQDLVSDAAGALKWAEILAAALAEPLAEPGIYCPLQQWQAGAAAQQ